MSLPGDIKTDQANDATLSDSNMATLTHLFQLLKFRLLIKILTKYYCLTLSNKKMAN